MHYKELTNRRNIIICIGALVFSLFFTIILRINLMLENRRRHRLSTDEYDREAVIEEPCDWVSSYLIHLIFSLLFSCSIPKYGTSCDMSTLSRNEQNELIFLICSTIN